MTDTVIVLYLMMNDMLSDIEINSVSGYIKQFLVYFNCNYPNTVEKIATSGDFGEDAETDIKKAVEDFEFKQ